MNELALARKAITEAVARAGDLPAESLVAVIAGDSALLAAVAEPDAITAALLKGAKAFPAKSTVYQQVGDLRHLLSRLDGSTPEA